MIATSGIDSDIKIWSPVDKLCYFKMSKEFILLKIMSFFKGFEHDSNVINDIRAAAEKNQKQMNQHPVELFFMNIQHCKCILKSW